jgi:O-antigen/teichoic acid export membrane protein
MSSLPVTKIEPPPAAVMGSTPGLSLRRNFSWTLVGNLVYAGCQWAVLVVLAKLVTPEMLGQFALGLAIVAPVLKFTNLELRGLQSTDARREYSFGQYLSVRVVTAVLALPAITAIAVLGHYPRSTALVVLAVALSKTFDSMSDVYYGLLQQHERMDRIAMSMIIQGSLQLAALMLVLFLTRSVLFGALAMAVVSAAVLVVYDLRSARLVLGVGRKRLPFLSGRVISRPRALICRRDIAALGQLVWLGLPLGVVMAINALILNVPRYFVENSHGERALGVFAAILYLTTIGSMVLTALSGAATPRLAASFARREYSAFWSLLTKLFGIAVLLGIAGFLLALVAGPQVLTVLYRPEYAKHSAAFVWLMAASGPTYVASILGLAVTSMRCFHVQVPCRCLHLVITYALCLYFIPRNGVEGAAWAVFFSAILSWLSMALLVTICVRWIRRHELLACADRSSSCSDSITHADGVEAPAR